MIYDKNSVFVVNISDVRSPSFQLDCILPDKSNSFSHEVKVSFFCDAMKEDVSAFKNNLPEALKRLGFGVWRNGDPRQGNKVISLVFSQHDVMW